MCLARPQPCPWVMQYPGSAVMLPVTPGQSTPPASVEQLPVVAKIRRVMFLRETRVANAAILPPISRGGKVLEFDGLEIILEEGSHRGFPSSSVLDCCGCCCEGNWCYSQQIMGKSALQS